jgi:transposase-like protein
MSDRKKRRRWTASETLRVVVTGLDGSVEISELCRREGINPEIGTGSKKWGEFRCARHGRGAHADTIGDIRAWSGSRHIQMGNPG